jgi:hypothetical protein
MTTTIEEPTPTEIEDDGFTISVEFVKWTQRLPEEIEVLAAAEVALRNLGYVGALTA